MVPYCGAVLELSAIDLEPIASALADQEDYETATLVDPANGETIFWSTDGGIDGKTPVDLDELDLIAIHPLPSRVWYEDMVDFAELVPKKAVARRLFIALEGKGAFRRFKDELHRNDPRLIEDWYAFRDARANRRAVEWLLDKELITEEAAARYFDDHPDPASEPPEPQRSLIYVPVRLPDDRDGIVRGGAFESESEAQKVLDIWRSDGRTEHMAIESLPVYETADEWQADR